MKSSPTPPKDSLSRRALMASAMALTLCFVGAVGFRLIEGWSWSDSLYMVLITVTTVGYGEVQPLSEAGRIWTFVLLVGGVGVVANAAAMAIQFVLEGEFTGVRRRRRMDKIIRQMSEHYIVCGYGRVGRQVAHDLTNAGKAVVVIEQGDEPDLERGGIAHVVGSAEEEQTLWDAGIKRAAGLVACVDSDTQNVFITLTAKALNNKVWVVARAGKPDTVRRLVQIGADRVVSPYSTSGNRMAHLAMNPSAMDFFEFFSDPQDSFAVEIEQVLVNEGSELAGSTLQDLNLRERTGALVIGIRGPAGSELNPDPSVVLHAGSLLLVIGTQEHCGRRGELNHGAAAKYSDRI